MPNEYGKSIDKTYLSLDKAEERGFIHRDYLAHALRWSHVVKFMQEKQRYKEASILDIGCGREAPLLKTLYTSRMLPVSYTGIDYGPIDIFQNIPSLEKYRNQISIVPNTNFLNVNPTTNQYRVIIMFEVLEHMEKDMGTQLLKHIKDFMLSTTTFFMSTPTYDGVNKAANHVREWTYVELEQELIDLGFKIVKTWGTFASIKDYKMELEKINGLPWLFEQLREYYDVNLLSVIFAPIFPQYSRNCLWQLTL